GIYSRPVLLLRYIRTFSVAAPVYTGVQCCCSGIYGHPALLLLPPLMDPALCSELVSFLCPGARAHVKSRALEYVLGVSGTPDGRRSLCEQPGLLRAVLDVTSDPSGAVVQDAYHILVNLTSDPCTHRALCDLQPLLPALVERLMDPGYVYASSVCTALCNLSREEETCRHVLCALQEAGLEKLLEMLCSPQYNAAAPLHYLGPLMCNLSQLSAGRAFLLDRNRCVLQRLLPYTHLPGSVVRRGGIVGTLRNCCFSHRDHAWLLGDDVDLLPFLLLPLAGGEEYTEDEMESKKVGGATDKRAELINCCLQDGGSEICFCVVSPSTGPAVSSRGQEERTRPRHKEDADRVPPAGETSLIAPESV
ncbi:hypothetical protein GDO81_027984, partial [Engystomops pustulosus]